MQTITDPAVIAMPFCASGDKNTIPTNATGSQLASLEEGFPAITATPIANGGIPPEREDFNGAMNLNSQFYFAFQNGWWPTFNASVSTAIGGYAEGAVLWWFPTTGSYANMAVPVRSLVANNTYNFNTNPAYIGPYWKPLYKDPSAMPIGTVFFHQSDDPTDVPGALPLFTGETISNADQLYPDFYAWVAAHTDLQISAANYSAAITAYGECPKYVIDTTNKTITLPKLTTYVKMANSTDGIEQGEAGLPDITATLYEENGVQNNHMASGGGVAESYTWSASAFNSIYGNSNTVTPQHTTLFPWVFAFNAAVPASTAQAAQFQAALSSKLDADFSNATKPYVTQTYHSGTSWYRIWSDGWCEQGGRLAMTSGAGFTNVALLVSYADTNYSLMVCMNRGTSMSDFRSGAIVDESNISVGYDNSASIWETKGYIR